MTHSGWHVGIVASALIYSVARLLDVPVSEMLLVAAALGAFLVYAGDRIWADSMADRTNAPDRWAWWQHSRPRNVLIMAWAGGGALYAGLHLPGRVLLSGIVFGAIGLWYGLPRTIVGQWQLKRLAGKGRGALIALVWGVGVVTLVAISAPRPSWVVLALLVAYRALWLAPDVVVAEYADKPGDALSGLPSMTSGWSVHRLRQFCWFMLLPTGLLAGLLYLQMGSGYGAWLAVDLAGMAASCMVIQRIEKVGAGHVFALDLLAAWPLIPALLFGGGG